MLKLDSVSRIFPGGQEALRNIVLELAQGEVVAMVGGSGCGKTTLLRLVAGLDAPSTGSIELDGADLHEPSADVGIIFQEPRLLPWLSVADNIAFGIAHLAREEREARVSRALLRIGLAGYETRWPRELSGGQAQRVAIARALVTQPKVLLLDEPFSALDAFTRASLHEHLLALWETDRVSLLIVTHDVDEAVTLADRIVVMQPKPGRIFTEIGVDLPRPRNRRSDEFHAVSRRVLDALDGSLTEGQSSAAPGKTETAAFWW
ncbi:MAG: ABC transporter ATP-binding protein [Beijerinckiaceae bacterium]|jgi:sulfonate transport system ATP-binding protein|nr:ABC transporter ATP-binding protein [Beijerinckiaceae bacterium]